MNDDRPLLIDDSREIALFAGGGMGLAVAAMAALGGAHFGGLMRAPVRIRDVDLPYKQPARQHDAHVGAWRYAEHRRLVNEQETRRIVEKRLRDDPIIRAAEERRARRNAKRAAATRRGLRHAAITV